ncbi:hypothetical protein EVAR_92428_1 [Eumeta japonica]|uniref:Reverse transcriptase domain-containing protein n=1 Tax=Eumeta variegata TaxID=151549 RepID=A0A4C1T6Q4_EUMVA|nr:hypothetical protein EVAR_92428_1 [Eumeta japonica]
MPQYADDQVILTSSACELKAMVIKINDYVNERAINIMVFERSKYRTECNIYRRRESRTSERVYTLGSLFTNYGKHNRDIKRRVYARNKVNGALHAIMSSKSVSQQARLAIHNGVLIPTLIYGSEGWVWQKKNKRRINVVKMRFLRNMCAVSLKDDVKTTITESGVVSRKM